MTCTTDRTPASFLPDCVLPESSTGWCLRDDVASPPITSPGRPGSAHVPRPPSQPSQPASQPISRTLLPLAGPRASGPTCQSHRAGHAACHTLQQPTNPTTPPPITPPLHPFHPLRLRLRSVRQIVAPRVRVCAASHGVREALQVHRPRRRRLGGTHLRRSVSGGSIDCLSGSHITISLAQGYAAREFAKQGVQPGELAIISKDAVRIIPPP